MSAFRAWCEPFAGQALADSRALHAWSIAERGAFWSALWDWCGVLGERGERALVDGDRMPGARWFPDARLNFAENLLRRRDRSPALVARDERGRRRVLSWSELRDEVARVAGALRGAGVGAGDRVAGTLPNIRARVEAWRVCDARPALRPCARML